jgi:DNA-binding Xre family transcriptional regulator
MTMKTELKMGTIMLKSKKKKIVKSSYEELIEDPKQKELLDKEYKELLISELIIAVMKKDDLSVRRLAKDAGVSPTIVQELKSGKRTNVTLSTFNRVLNALGYQVSFEPLRK